MKKQEKESSKPLSQTKHIFVLKLSSNYVEYYIRKWIFSQRIHRDESCNFIFLKASFFSLVKKFKMIKSFLFFQIEMEEISISTRSWQKWTKFNQDKIRNAGRKKSTENGVWECYFSENNLKFITCMHTQ